MLTTNARDRQRRHAVDVGGRIEFDKIKPCDPCPLTDACHQVDCLRTGGPPKVRSATPGMILGSKLSQSRVTTTPSEICRRATLIPWVGIHERVENGCRSVVLRRQQREPPIETEAGLPHPRHSSRPVEALDSWIEAARIASGSLFRKVDCWGNVSKRALEAVAVNAIVKQRAEMAGLDGGEFSAHGLRSGYLTEAANRGIPFPEAWSNLAIDRSSMRHVTIITPRGG